MQRGPFSSQQITATVTMMTMTMETAVRWSCVLLLLSSWPSLVTSISSNECSNALGMESNAIKNSQITSARWLYSDTERNRHFRPHFARLNFKQRGGAWCSADVETYPNQHLDIDLLVNTRLTGLAIQGKYGGTEYAQTVQLSYMRSNDTAYRQYNVAGQWKKFNFNVLNGTETTMRFHFDHDVIARKIRLFPETALFSVFCVRLELYGCRWTKQTVGLISYEASGTTDSPASRYRDDAYDGMRSAQGALTRGLGRLTDDDASSTLGHQVAWVGFSSPTPVVTFQFAEMTSLSRVTVHVFHKDQDNLAFKTATVFCSSDGVSFDVIKFFDPEPSLFSAYGAYDVAIPLGVARCRFLRCGFVNAGSLLLISEFDFTAVGSDGVVPGGISTTASTPANVPSTPRAPATGAMVPPSIAGPRTQSPTVPIVLKTRPPAETVPATRGNGIPGMVGLPSADTSKGLSFPIVLTIVLGGVVVLAVIAIFVVRQCRKRMRDRGRSQCYKAKPTGNANTTELLYEEKISLQGSSLVRYYPTAATSNVRQPFRTT